MYKFVGDWWGYFCYQRSKFTANQKIVILRMYWSNGHWLENTDGFYHIGNGKTVFK